MSCSSPQEVIQRGGAMSPQREGGGGGVTYLIRPTKNTSWDFGGTTHPPTHIPRGGGVTDLGLPPIPK